MHTIKCTNLNYANQKFYTQVLTYLYILLGNHHKPIYRAFSKTQQAPSWASPPQMTAVLTSISREEYSACYWIWLPWSQTMNSGILIIVTVLSCSPEWKLHESGNLSTLLTAVSTVSINGTWNIVGAQKTFIEWMNNQNSIIKLSFSWNFEGQKLFFSRIIFITITNTYGNKIFTSKPKIWLKFLGLI